MTYPLPQLGQSISLSSVPTCLTEIQRLPHFTQITSLTSCGSFLLMGIVIFCLHSLYTACVVSVQVTVALRALLKAWINCSSIYFAAPFFAPVVIPDIKFALITVHPVTSAYSTNDSCTLYLFSNIRFSSAVKQIKYSVPFIMYEYFCSIHVTSVYSSVTSSVKVCFM